MFGIQSVVQIHITVIAKGQVLDLNVVARDVEHGEITISPLRLSPVAGQHHILRTVSHADDARPVETHLHAVGDVLARLGLADSRVVWVVYPENTRSDMDHRPKTVIGKRLCPTEGFIHCGKHAPPLVGLLLRVHIEPMLWLGTDSQTPECQHD